MGPMKVLNTMINNILFRVVRETKSLAYEVSFEMSLPLHYETGMAFLRVTPSSPDKLDQCYQASFDVLRGLKEHCTPREFKKAVAPLIKSTEASIHTNDSKSLLSLILILIWRHPFTQMASGSHR